jgi:hypothetical protein
VATLSDPSCFAIKQKRRLQMRIDLLSGVLAAVFLVGMPMAMAQSDSNEDNGADTTCADFMAMDTADQTALVEQMQSATPDLKTNGAEGASGNASGGVSANAQADDASGSSAGDAVNDDNASADVKAGAAADSNVAEVLAACESDSNLSVGDALTR